MADRMILFPRGCWRYLLCHLIGHRPGEPRAMGWALCARCGTAVLDG